MDKLIRNKLLSNRLLISNQTNINMRINNIGHKKSLYLYNIKGCSIYINNKVNNIFCEKCDLVNIYFESTINSFDIYNCGKIYIHCSDKLPMMIVEKVESLVTVFKGVPFDTIFIVMATYNIICHSLILKRNFPIKFSMFQDRFSTLFVDEKPIHNLLPFTLANTNSIISFN
jgi:hypothetical protein